MRTLKLKAENIKGEGEFELGLTEPSSVNQTGVLARHKVELDADDPQWERLRNLPGAWKALGTRPAWVEAEAKMIVELGEWISEKILGRITEKLVELAPAAVWVEQTSDEVAWLVEVPLTMAFQKDQAHSGVSLADRRVIFPVEFPPPQSRLMGGDPRPRPGEPLRMLAAFSSPTNEQGLSLRQERYQLASMARELVERKSKAIDLKVLQYGATAELLKEALGDAEGWDIVHLSGHGAPGVLMFENKSGQAIPVETDDLLGWLEGAGSRLKLVTLMSCSSAASVTQPWLVAMGVGDKEVEDATEERVQHGLASKIADKLGCTVVAMRYQARDRFCIDFSQGLYTSMWKHNHSAISAAATALRDSVPRPPTQVSPLRSMFTPAVFGTPLTADVRLAPPDRIGPEPILNPKMAGFRDEPKVFVGRVDVLAAVNVALASGSGVSGVFLHGGMGIGKSYCAREIAHGRQDDFSSLSFFKFDEIDGGDVIPDFNHLADELVRKLNVATTDRVANPEQWLEQVTEAMELRGVLLVFDQIELLLTDAGTWKDPRWAKMFSALTNHRGQGRIIATSRVPPPAIDRTLSVEVKSLSRRETVLLAQQLPRLRTAFDAPMNGRPAMLDILSVTRGNPQMLALAEMFTDEPDVLNSMIQEARDIWNASGVDFESFMREDVADG